MCVESTASSPTSTDEAELRRWLERALSQSRRKHIEILGMQRQPSPFASLFPAEEITLTLATGETLTVFGKYLGPEESDHPEKQCRDREIRIYEELLRDPALPVVRYYGSRWDEQTQRRQLFLEHLDDWTLNYHDLAYWFIAARRLAEFHAYFAAQREPLLRCDYLIRLDQEYLTQWARRASKALEPGLAQELDPVVRQYERVTAPIAAQPLTLVHNDLAPKNVIAFRGSNPPRIALVDWEMAGVGCGVLDLVHLNHGLGEADAVRMCDEYFAALTTAGGTCPQGNECARVLAACELHITIYRLFFARQWCVEPKVVTQWVSDVRRLFAKL